MSGRRSSKITPLHPLTPSTCIANGQFLGANCATGNGYLVVLTNGIQDAGGNAAQPDTDYASIRAAALADPNCASISDATLNGICRLTASRSAAPRPASIAWRAPNESRSKRRQSAALGNRTGAATARTSTSA